MNKLGKETRLISCTKEEWSKISDILDGRIPKNEFDPILYINSKDSLSKLKASSFRKNMYDESVKFYLRLSHELGLDFGYDADISNMIDVKFNNTMLKDNNYDIFVHLIKMNMLKTSVKTAQAVEYVDEI